jgi:predicted nucleic acid-binding protein
MSGDFLDSNVFVYLFDETDDRKRRIAERLVREALAHGTACISFQVAQETLHVLTKQLKRPAGAEDARRLLASVLAPLMRVLPSATLYEQALDVRSRTGYGFYDSLVVAAAQSAGCRRLLSEDLQHGQRLGRLVIENPFAG